MGLAVRAFVAPGDAALATRGTYPTFAYHVAGYGGRPIVGRLPRRRNARLRRAAGDGAARRCRRSCTWPIPTIRAADSSRATRWRAFYEALPHDSLLLLDEAYADFVDESELLAPVSRIGSSGCARFRKPTAWPARASVTRSPRERNVATLSEDSPAIRRQPQRADRRAGIAAATTSFADTSSPRPRWRAKSTTRSRESWAARYIESRTNFVCIEIETRRARDAA